MDLAATKGISLTIDNSFLADELDRYAGLLDLWEANRFAVRAYRRAADVIRGSPVSIADLVRTGTVRDLNGIGPGVEARLRELVETGELRSSPSFSGRSAPS